MTRKGAGRAGGGLANDGKREGEVREPGEGEKRVFGQFRLRSPK